MKKESILVAARNFRRKRRGENAASPPTDNPPLASSSGSLLKTAVCCLAFAACAFFGVKTAAAANVETEPYYFYAPNYKTELNSLAENYVVNPAETGFEGTAQALAPDTAPDLGPTQAVYFGPNQSATFQVTVAEPGGYNITLDYYVPDEFLFNLTLAAAVNGEYQFYESRSLDMPVRWEDISQDYKVDAYGNDMYPRPRRIYTWETRALNSQLYLLKTPFVFILKEGVNTITIENNEIPFLLGNVTLSGKQDLITAREYIESQAGKSLAGGLPVVIEGEHYSAKSQSFIIPAKSSDQHAYPYTPGHNRINSLREVAWADSGNFVEYTFSVDEDALYYIVMKYTAKVQKNKPNFKNIYLDGRPIFDEAMNYIIRYSPKYRNEVINADGENIPVYLTKGEHTLRLESTGDLLYDTRETLIGVIGEINELAIQIKYITGNKADKNREWEIETYIPNIREDLLRFADIMETEYNVLAALSRTSGGNVADNLLVARDTLIEFSGDLDKLVNNMDRFTQGSNSVTEYISLVLPVMLYQNMAIDKIYITGDLNSVPEPTLGFFAGLWEEVRKFAATFTAVPDQAGLVTDDKLNIWVGKNMMQVELMRDTFTRFTEETGMEVNLSSMADEQKLLLAVSAGTAPDMVIGASNYRPFDFALRGAIYDLRRFPDFPLILEDYNPEMFVPFIINDSCYAVPETINFIMTYYRKDILNALGLPVPRTWDDVIAILPELSRFGMSVNTPIANAGGIKHFGTTMPFIQQFDGKIYSEDGSRVEFGDPNTVAAFKLMTDLYTRYSLPESISSFYNSFKRGVTPIGMSGLDTYYLIRYATPELSGQWGMAPSIGVESGGEVRNYQAAVASCSMIMAGTKRPEDAWEALKWWMEDETQTAFGNDLQLRFGSDYVYNTANMKAFARVKSMPEDVKALVLEQLANTREIPRNPAYFQVERALANSWNAVVFQGVTPRTALDDAIILSNREITKKLKEFGYMDERGALLKPFEMGSSAKVESWKAGGGE
ncbi:MAG: extracellular solute-binding protein [Clostridiales bacterium]|jgi:ABC-type glycerol-3-phosphate transport system substrate-binding protein|nr:extracellular solute-binding protein [Clostridiales bacterium]